MNQQDKWISRYNHIVLAIFAVIIVLAIYIMANDIGTQGKDYGPGAYYYTDVPQWKEIVYPEIYNDK